MARFGWTRFAAAALVGAVAATAGGCIFFSNFDGLEGGTTSGGGSGGSGGDAGADHEPPCDALSAATTDYCTAIPRAPSGFQQSVDGVPTEFCDVAYQDLLQTKIQFRSDCPPPAWAVDAAVDAKLRMLWSDLGLHLFVEVRKKGDLAFNTAAPYHADAIEIFVADADPLTGDAVADHLFHAIIAPAEMGGPADQGGQQLPKSDVAAVAVEGGYDVELFIPWSYTGGAVPKRNQHIGFDFVLDTGEADADADAHYSSALHYKLSGEIEYCKEPSDPKVEADDLAWCTTQLAGLGQ